MGCELYFHRSGPMQIAHDTWLQMKTTSSGRKEMKITKQETKAQNSIQLLVVNAMMILK